MRSAAERFLELLTPELKAKALVPFDSAARTDWHFVPRTRPGVTLGEMTDAQRIAARNLLRSALSSQGMLKAESIMALEDVLRDMERAAGGDGAARDPRAYTLTVYGEPSTLRPWGWKIEGHHLSLNFTLPREETVTTTPAFMGTSPAEVKSGLKAGHRVLAAEEELGRRLVKSLSVEQLKTGLLTGEVPREVLTLPGRPLSGVPDAGVPYADLRPEQQEILVALLSEFAGNLRHELAEAELERIRKAGLDNVRFAWAGATEPGRPHYYRVSGPTFIIEYDNTQNDANHVHTVWHDRERDFGRDLLKEHYEHGHEHK